MGDNLFLVTLIIHSNWGPYGNYFLRINVNYIIF
jgi:hypothetical protein